MLSPSRPLHSGLSGYAPGISRRVLLFGLPAACLVSPQSLLAADLPQPPLGFYHYSMTEADRGAIGESTTELKQDGEVLEAQVERRVRVRILGITVYRYESKMTQRVQGGRLISLSRDTDDNGDEDRLRITARDGALAAERNGESWTLAGDLLPSSAWNPQVIAAKELIDIETGKAVPVDGSLVGEGEVLAAGRRSNAQRVKQGGALDRDLWFDAKGRLLRMVVRRRGATVTFALTKAPA
ncbi:MAG: DUF6134 family protein [Pseudomonadota bacterium]